MSETVIKGVTWKNPRGYAPLAAAAAQWSQHNPGYRVEWEAKPWYEFEDAVLSSLSGIQGFYDLIMYDHPWGGSLVAEKWLTPWEDVLGEDECKEIEKRMIEPSADSYRFGGRLYGLPLDAACHISVERSDKVRLVDTPQTWEELESWARSVVSKSLPYPLVLSVEGVLGSCLLLTLLASLDSPGFHEMHEVSYDREKAAYALELVRRLLSYAPPDSTHWGPWDIYEALVTRSDVGYSPSIFAYVNYCERRPFGSALKFGTPPRFKAKKVSRPILGGVGLGLAHQVVGKPYLQQVLDYSIFLTQDDVQASLFVDNHGQPAAKSVWDDARIDDRFNGFYGATRRAMKDAYIRPRYKGFHERELRIGRVLQPYWDGSIGVSEVLSRLDEV